jgi:hypothetical protein
LPDVESRVMFGTLNLKIIVDYMISKHVKIVFDCARTRACGAKFSPQTQMSDLVAINAWILCPDMSYFVALNA